MSVQHKLEALACTPVRSRLSRAVSQQGCLGLFKLRVKANSDRNDEPVPEQLRQGLLMLQYFCSDVSTRWTPAATPVVGC